MITVDTYGGILDRDVTRGLILSVMAGLTPIFATLQGAGLTERTVEEKFEWQVSQVGAVRTQINNGGSAYTSGTTTLVVDSTAGMYPDCLLLAEATGEIMLVTAVSSATEIVVVRGIGSDVAAHANSVADDAYLQVISHAAGEGGNVPADRVVAASTLSNWVQQFKRSVSISGRAAAVAAKTEDERNRQRQLALEEFSQSIERAILFGAADNDTVGSESKRVTTTAGLFQKITTNVDNVAGTMTWDRFDTFLRDYAFVYGSGEKWLYGGATLIDAIHKVLKGKLQIMSNNNVVGLPVRRYESPFGSLNLVLHRGLRGVYAGHGVVVEREQLMIKYLEREQGGLPHLLNDVHQKGADAATDMWVAELGLKWGDQLRHALIKGVTGPA